MILPIHAAKKAGEAGIKLLCGKHLSSLGSSALQHIPASLGLHSLSESVLFLALPLFRLKRSFHRCSSLFPVLSQIF